jgi:hypothetical protein
VYLSEEVSVAEFSLLDGTMRDLVAGLEEFRFAISAADDDNSPDDIYVGESDDDATDSLEVVGADDATVAISAQ